MKQNKSLSKEEIMAVILETSTYDDLKRTLLNKLNLKEETAEKSKSMKSI